MSFRLLFRKPPPGATFCGSWFRALARGVDGRIYACCGSSLDSYSD
jgi:hypothetical protein